MEPKRAFECVVDKAVMRPPSDYLVFNPLMGAPGSGQKIKALSSNTKSQKCHNSFFGFALTSGEDSI
jgi:hypothetical protein